MSRWFTRGWTLQELLAPRHIEFYANDWRLIGEKRYYSGPYNLRPEECMVRAAPIEPRPLHALLSRTTGIQEHVFDQPDAIGGCSIARRMSWAACRQGSRKEDESYCLMGIFRVNMPILYGEGREQAFKRLQLEIMRSSDDMSIFAWRDIEGLSTSSLLSTSPRHFKDSDNVVLVLGEHGRRTKRPFTMKNQGLSITLRYSSRRVQKENTDFICWAMLDGIKLMIDDSWHAVGLYLTPNRNQFGEKDYEQDCRQDAQTEFVCLRKRTDTFFIGQGRRVGILPDTLNVVGSYRDLLIPEHADNGHF